jgi:hypothetical protein
MVVNRFNLSFAAATLAASAGASGVADSSSGEVTALSAEVSK